MFEEPKPTLIIDSREQLPYGFNRFHDQFKEIRRGKLLCGDYSIHCFETKICVERKSLPDLVNTVIHGRDRFKRELAKMHNYDYAAIVIEASLKDVSSPYGFSQANPKSVVGSLQSFGLVYGVHVIFANDRVHAEAWIADTLLKFYRYHRENQP